MAFGSSYRAKTYILLQTPSDPIYYIFYAKKYQMITSIDREKGFLSFDG